MIDFHGTILPAPAAVLAAAALAIVVVPSAFAPVAHGIEPDAPLRLMGFEETVGITVLRRLDASNRRLTRQQKSQRKDLAIFYRSHGNQPVWVDGRGLTARALAVIAEIGKAGDWALPAGAFAIPDLAVSTDHGPRLSARILADAELKLTRAVLKYARFARGGRSDPARITEFLDRKLPFIATRQVMQQVASSDDPAAAVRAFHPAHPQFLALLKQYHVLMGGRDQDKKIDQPKLPAGPSLKLGMKHSRIAILRKRLNLAAVDPWQRNMFSADVDVAVRAFQEKAGLEADGIVGSGTRRALNGRQAKGSPQKLLVNIEQWRWMPAEMGSMYVLVNIPEYKVRVVSDNKVVHTERVVVGKTNNQTPIFTQNMQWIEFHPSWYVPTSIKVREIGPSIRRRGQSFLDGMNLKVTCPEGAYSQPKKTNFWGSPQPKRRIADIRNCRVVQGPGPKNVLGVVKFKFPNKHAVYLHDTTSKSLFNKSVRTYSHGCVRVRDPLKLAEIILQQDQGMSRARIQSIVNGPVQTQQTYLKKKLPVHVTYFTAFADKNGKIRYFNDIYGHEKRIALAMKGRYGEITPVPVAKGPTRVARRAPVRKKPKNLFETIFGGFN